MAKRTPTLPVIVTEGLLPDGSMWRVEQEGRSGRGGVVSAVAFLRRTFRGRSRSRTCESCGAPADVVLKDGSLWCWPCHSSALRLRYDQDFGRAL